jgi:hypothetical protein
VTARTTYTPQTATVVLALVAAGLAACSLPVQAPSAPSSAPSQSGASEIPVNAERFSPRQFDCPVPAFGGIVGQVTLTVTFAPDGKFVTASGRGGNPDLVRAARAVVSRCRAEPLPSDARQANQSAQATFVFRAQ